MGINGLDEAQAGITIARKNTNKLGYADDTTIIPENDEKLKSLLMKVKEERGKPGLKLNQKPKIMASDPITSLQTVVKQWQTIFLDSEITENWKKNAIANCNRHYIHKNFPVIIVILHSAIA